MNTLQTLPLSSIRIDGGTQPRTEIDYSLVSEYAESVDSLPPVVVFFDGATHWLADGFHRYFAHKNLKKESIPCEIKTGSLRDAILYSVGANAVHGKRRTNADKRKAVLTLLNDKEWSLWTGAEIARQCAVSEMSVSRIKSEIRQSNNVSVSENKELKYTTKHGTVATMNTANIGKKTPLSKPDTPTSYTAPLEEQGPEEDNTVYSEEAGDLFEEKSEYEKVLEEGQTLKSNSQKSSNMHYASFAISQLERINKKEPDAKTAFDAVVLWIERNR
jgi:hypothetical protein